MRCFIDIYLYILKISKLAPTDHHKLPLHDYFLKNSILKFQGRVRNTMPYRLEDADGLPFYTKKCMTVWYFISRIIYMITIWLILCFNIVQSLCYFHKSVCCHTLSSRAQASRCIGPSKLYPPLVRNT